MKVKVLKFAGETGLRNVGSEYHLDTVTAEKLIQKGFVAKVMDLLKKEDKTVIETKELKFKRQTKKRK